MRVGVPYRCPSRGMGMGMGRGHPPFWSFYCILIIYGTFTRLSCHLDMAGCLDNFQWPQWECCDVGEKRNAIASIIAGAMVSNVMTIISF